MQPPLKNIQLRTVASGEYSHIAVSKIASGPRESEGLSLTSGAIAKPNALDAAFDDEFAGLLSSWGLRLAVSYCQTR